MEIATSALLDPGLHLIGNHLSMHVTGGTHATGSDQGVLRGTFLPHFVISLQAIDLDGESDNALELLFHLIGRQPAHGSVVCGICLFLLD